MGPFEDAKPWDMRGIEGIARFLRRVWVLLQEPVSWTKEPGLVSLRHRTIAKVTSDIEGYRFNTAISALMIYSNEIQKQLPPSRGDAETLLALLNPFAPHLTEELWESLGYKEFLSVAPWPVYEERFLKDDRVELAVQVNGKLRARLEAQAGAPEQAVREAALSLPKVREGIGAKPVVRVIIVPDKLVNIVVK
ncbi:MAG: class I tRNA ligase family protein [Elusimicrobia bacterium]|nr:class I tRNA ligase family protein [Elusimicrobiota bacterium]